MKLYEITGNDCEGHPYHAFSVGMRVSLVREPYHVSSEKMAGDFQSLEPITSVVTGLQQSEGLIQSVMMEDVSEVSHEH